MPAHPALLSTQAGRRARISGDDLGAKTLWLAEVEEPVVGQVLVRLRAASLNYRDLLMRASSH